MTYPVGGQSLVVNQFVRAHGVITGVVRQVKVVLR